VGFELTTFVVIGSDCIESGVKHHKTNQPTENIFTEFFFDG
jgi:hypothetical protein